MGVEKLQFTEEETILEESNVIGFSDKIGKMLVTARREKELTVTQIAKILNIRVEYLSAFEKNDFSNMPEGSYTQGFLKSYATYLDLDGDAMVQELKQAGYLTNSIKHHIPQPIETNIMPSRTIILSTLAVLALLLSVWGIYALKSENIITIPAPEEVAVAPAPTTIETPVVIDTPPATVTPEPNETPETAITPAEVAVTEEIPVPATTEETPVIANEGRILLVMSDEVWMQLRSPEGKVYMNKVFHSGDEYWITSPKDTVLDVGKPSVVTLYIDGQEATPWENNARRVIKGMTTDVESILQLHKDMQ